MSGFATDTTWPYGDFQETAGGIAPGPGRQSPRSGLAPALAPHFSDQSGFIAQFEQSPELQRLLGAMTTKARAQFTPQHLAALEVAITRSRPRPDYHKADLRVSVPFFGKRYYMRFLAGTERRSKSRLEHEGQNRLSRQSLMVTVLISGVVTTALIAMIFGFYILKTLAGVDIFEDHSLFHQFLSLKTPPS